MSRLTAWLQPTTIAHAHCDIPCGIYDPSEAVLALVGEERRPSPMR